MRQERLGGLRVRITGGSDGRGGGEGPLVVLLHGYGAPGEDLVPLWQVLDVPRGTRFVFPEAPLSLASGLGESRAWWMLDLDRLQRDQAAGKPRDLSGEVPKGLAEARTAILALLDEASSRWGTGVTILGGFSQGAMLACDVALRTARPLAGLVLLSGTLLAKQQWIPLMPRRRDLPVLQSHGTGDQLLSFLLAEQLRDHLSHAGLSIEWIPFRGGHEIPPMVIHRLGPFIRRVIGR